MFQRGAFPHDITILTAARTAGAADSMKGIYSHFIILNSRVRVFYRIKWINHLQFLTCGIF